MSQPRILIADDQADVREALRLLCKVEGFAPVLAASPEEALEHARSQSPDVALIDLNYTRDTTSGDEGMDLLSALAAQAPHVPVVVMTAWSTVAGAVEAMRRGARDYVAKPWDNAALVATLRAQLAASTASRTEPKRADEGGVTMVARAPCMQRLVDLAMRVAPSDAAVLVSGEHGTGKEVMARTLHANSERKTGPFVAINAGGFAEGVFESELFGHVKGAFTDARADRKGAFEQAHGGTLFLDEIGTMPLAQQGKLLRVLQTGELYRVGSSRVVHVDVRLIAATNADLAREAEAGRFREDLLYRINTVELRIPPLRERREDVPELVALAIARHAKRRGSAPTFSERAMSALCAHDFPGNVRELEHVVERAILLARGGVVEEPDLALRPRTATRAPLERMTLDEAERYLIERALERASGNVVEAAAELGLSRSAMYRRLARHGLGGP